MEDVRIIEKLPPKERVELESISITDNGEYTSERGKAYNSISVEVSGGGTVVEFNDVNFYDYDGTTLYSYTKNDFLALTEMPDNPIHEGLTSQGWNWNLTDAKLYVQSHGMLSVGQSYITDDQSTRLYIYLKEGRTSPQLGFKLLGTTEVDWGDGSAVVSVTNNTMKRVNLSHTYSTPGYYVISIMPESSAELNFNGYGSNATYVIVKDAANGTTYDKIYASSMYKVELGRCITIDTYAFCNCYSLESITIPDYITNIGLGAFYCCYSLKHITFKMHLDQY